MITFALGTVYILGSISVLVYYWRERRSEFNWFTHGVFPVVSTIAMILICSTNRSIRSRRLPSSGARLWWGGCGLCSVCCWGGIRWPRPGGSNGSVPPAKPPQRKRPETPEELAHPTQLLIESTHMDT